ncbi:MAG: hypothetical protein DHS20C17_26950 [Cyclobacteriaceae bacterium]|nr:MAG: hypothetical protein DHS20C17_26950 [Cyclobacteriaceae bacterium]
MKLTKVTNLFQIDRMIDHLVGFVETRLEILKLDFKEESVRVIAKLLTMAVIVLFSTLFFIFFSVMLAIILNRALGSEYLGYAILAGFFLLLLISVLVIKQTQWYHNKITSITDQLVEDPNDTKHERDPKIPGNSR